MIRIDVSISPRPKKRPKVYRWATVNPSLKDEEELADEVRKHPNCPDQPLKGLIRVNLRFYKKFPKSTPKWKLPLIDSGHIRPNNNPDLDNYIKLVLDALNGIIWADDRYIIELTASKYFAIDKPHIVIEFETTPEIVYKKDVSSDLMKNLG